MACPSELRRALLDVLGEEHFRFHAEKPKANGGNGGGRKQRALV